MHPNEIQFRPATPADRDSINALYGEWGYTGGIAAPDLIWVAATKTGPIGVCRIAPEIGTHVFRGLYITERQRGRGIGRELASKALEAAAVSVCYCVPNAHLVLFYRQLGFVVIENEAVPTFLRERVERYKKKGLDVTVMRRDSRITHKSG
jgi:GNAT superfamily N-acetyltransferase